MSSGAAHNDLGIRGLRQPLLCRLMQECELAPVGVSLCCSAGTDLAFCTWKLGLECVTASSSPDSLCWLTLLVSSCAAVSEGDECFLYACRAKSGFSSHSILIKNCQIIYDFLW